MLRRFSAIERGDGEFDRLNQVLHIGYFKNSSGVVIRKMAKFLNTWKRIRKIAHILADHIAPQLPP